MTSSFPQTLADLDQAASGTALFDADTANKPDGVTGPGTVNTIYRDDIGWQMLIVNDAPREFWQRTRKPAAPHWRNWRRFVDFRTVNDAIDAAIITERAAIDRSVNSKTAIIDARVTTSDANLATERSERMAADTAEAGRREAAMTAEAAAREHAVRALDTKVTGDIAAAERRSDTKLETAITAEAAQRSIEIQTKIGEARMAINGAIATAVATERDARMAADRASDRAMTTQIANSGFPSGTKMLFQQSSAPTGWTKDTAHNDKALRVVSGSVGSGGSHGFSARFGRGNVGVTSAISGRTAEHVITEAQMPRHRHSSNGSFALGRPDENDGTTANAIPTHTRYRPSGHFRFGVSVAEAGNNQPHSHGAGSLRVSSSVALNVRYVDVIIATKD